MLILATEAGDLITLAIGVLGVAGLVFTALKYNRDDTTAILSQQNVIVDEMRVLNDELRNTVTTLRAERDELKAQVDRLTGQVEALRHELHSVVPDIERRRRDA